jgi:hypothetical protein
VDPVKDQQEDFGQAGVGGRIIDHGLDGDGGKCSPGRQSFAVGIDGLLFSGAPGIDGFVPDEIGYVEEWHGKIAPLFRLQELRPMGKKTEFLYSKRNLKMQQEKIL